jgi:hypothetical protein
MRSCLARSVINTKRSNPPYRRGPCWFSTIEFSIMGVKISRKIFARAYFTALLARSTQTERERQTGTRLVGLKSNERANELGRKSECERGRKRGRDETRV